MPIQKEKKYEITFKNLRHREIPCLVMAVPQKESGCHNSSATSIEQKNSRSKILKCLKRRLNRLSKTQTKKSKSLSCLDKKSELISKVTKKRVYRKKSLDIENSPRKKPTSNEFKAAAEFTNEIPVERTESPKKRIYRRKSLDIENSPRKNPTSNEFKAAAEFTNEIPVERTESPKKRIYRRKSLDIENSPRKNTTSNEFKAAADFTNGIPVDRTESPKKRIYRRKMQGGVTITPITESQVTKSVGTGTFFGTPIITPETPKKRVYRKKLKIPAVPHNTPVLGRGSNGDSISNTSFLRHSEVITVGKRGRGRPRLSMPAVPLGSDNGEESTVSLGSDKGSTTKRVRKSVWALGSDNEGEEENQVSEYELLRQRNIEENLKKLREIFTEQGLQFEEKPSDTPKKRKGYSRLPLPPPRPRSQRIEIRKTFMPLDFSKLDEKLTLSEAAFM